MLCPICKINEVKEGEKYCSSCEEVSTKLGIIMQSMGATAEEAAAAIKEIMKGEC